MAASFSLIIEDDAGKQIVVPFAKDVITIGRKEGNTIRLTERNVSRFHAKLLKENGSVRVEDLSSFNGIKLNGDRISGVALVNSGDVIEIGDYHLELRAAQPAGVGPVGSKSVGVGVGPSGRDDFEGDTQRWDAPAPQSVTQRSPAHGGFGGDGGDTERLDLGRLQSLAAGGQMAQPPPELPPPQSWPAPPRLSGIPSSSSLLDLEPTARQPIAGVPVGSAAPPPPAFNSALHDPTQDLAQPRPMALRELMADPAESVPAAASMPPPSFSPPPSFAPAPTVPSAAPSPTPARAAPRRNVEETEQLRVAPGAPAVDEHLSFPRLFALNTIFAGLEFPLKAMENVLGRTEDNDIVIEHRSISRNHAKFVRQGERVQVLDLKSANGVLVNGNEVDQHTLRSGDVVELGRVKLRFVPVGERFTLASDEVERARLADHGGDEFEDGAKTTMVQHGGGLSSAPAAPSRPIALYAVLAVLAVLVVFLAALLLLRGGGQANAAVDATEVAPTAPTAATPTTAQAASTAPTNGAAPAAAPVAAPDAPTEPTPPAEQPTLTAPQAAPETVDATEPPGPASGTKTRTPRKAFDLDASLQRVRDLYTSGNFAGAIVILKEVEQRYPRVPQYKSQIALYYAKNHDSKNALVYFNRFKEVASDPAEVENLRKLLVRNGINAGP
jgi:pSer/pThr/pTyr-binding forkhead associated (FHA) protein